MLQRMNIAGPSLRLGHASVLGQQNIPVCFHLLFTSHLIWVEERGIQSALREDIAPSQDMALI